MKHNYINNNCSPGSWKVEAASFGNVALLNILTRFGGSEGMSSDFLDELLLAAIMSDSATVCQKILSICHDNQHTAVSEKMKNVAVERGNVEIMRIMSPNYGDQMLAKKESL